MLTIFNIINYLIGKPIPFYILILITIIMYYYIISTFWDNIISNKIYLVINIILLLIDITAIIMIFTVFHDNNCIDYSTPQLKEKKNKKDKKDKKDKKNKKNKNDDIKNLENNNNVNNENALNEGEKLNKNLDKSIISLYEPEKDVSLKTYTNKLL